MENGKLVVDEIQKMKEAVERVTKLVSRGLMFTDEDAKLLQQTIDWFASHRNKTICFDALRGMPQKQLAEIWGLSEARISQIVSKDLLGGPIYDRNGDMVPYTQHPKVLDYTDLLRPDSVFGEGEKVYGVLREYAKGIQRIPDGKQVHDFKCMWSIGNPDDGYEFSHKHPGNEAHATGEIESWTPEMLCDHLNAMEKLRGPMISTGAVTGRVSCAEPNTETKPSRGRAVCTVTVGAADKVMRPQSVTSLKAKQFSVREIGKRFKERRLAAGLNQTEAGKLIGESQGFVSLLERGQKPSRKVQPSGLKLSLQEFESVLKTLHKL